MIDGDIVDADRVRLHEVPAPVPPPAEQAEMDRIWDGAVRANPKLFDGPLAGCVSLERDRGAVTISWARTTYRRTALRRVPGATAVLPALFASVVQPTDDGRVLVGRMAQWTAHAGRWQLPGGNVEPPADGEVLDAAALPGHGARELHEEIGVLVDPADLALRFVVHPNGANIGVVFVAPPRPEAELRACFAASTAAELARGDEPELVDIAFVRTSADAVALGGSWSTFVLPVLDRLGA